ncbi:MAG: divalent-cation tolerance protein CutA [Sphingomicrobium sp.]
MTVAIVYAVFADVDEAKRIGRTLVEERLAACINILGPCTSIYWWEGEVAQSDEAPAILKTTIEQADTLIARLADLHSYEVPAIAVWPAERAHHAFAEWVESELR